MSRIKSYIDGKLKFCDIMHPSKIPAPTTSRNRHYITYYTSNSHHKYDLYADTKLKNWNRRVESKLAAYINGEASARDLVHPSKFSELSAEVLRYKLQKSRMLHAQQRTLHSQQASRLRSTDWIDLGQQLEAQCAQARTQLLSQQQLSTSHCAETCSGDAQPVSAIDLLPLDAKNVLVAQQGQPSDLIPSEHPEAPTSTLVFNGNVNILCFSVGSQSQPAADGICNDIKRELRMLSTYTILPAANEEQRQPTYDDCTDQQQLQCSGSSYTTDAGDQSATRMLQAVAHTASQSSNVHELVTIVNELLPTVQTLRNQYKRVLADCKELTMERKILLKHQEISDKTIALLSDESKELKERNVQLAESSENAIYRLSAETQELKLQNEQLRQQLTELRLSERELIDVNRTLIRQLRNQKSEQNDLSTILAHIKRNLTIKLANLDRCFDTIDECIERTENEVRQMQRNCSFTEKKALVNTIRRLDEQNSDLMGKVKHMPEKIKSILNHISGTMSSLEEQNIRLLRTLQNSETETFFQNHFLSRLKT